jgi:hypothetical protein
VLRFFLGMLGVIGSGGMGVMGGGSVGLVELFGAVRAFEFMPLAGNGNQGNSHEQEREKFHRAAS